MSCSSTGVLNQCTLCRPGYFLSSNVCKECPTNCKYCSGDDQQVTCNSCLDGFYLTPKAFQCLPCLENCDICASSVSCSTCEPGYFLNSLQTQCVNCNQGCSQCYSSNTCISCFSGYFLDVANTTCTRCASPCLECVKSSTTCLNCVLGYFMDESGKCTQCEENCQICSVDGCLACSFGFYNYLNVDTGRSECLECPDNC